MAPHRAEADAVREMGDLYAWGEVLVKGLESEGVDGGDGGVEGSLGGDSGLMEVAKAARRFCVWLKDWRAWGACKRVEGLMRDLEREEMRERCVSIEGSRDRSVL